MSDFREEEDDSLNALLRPLDEAAGPARRITREKSAAMVLAALEASARAAHPPRRPRGKRPPVWLIAGALLGVGAAAAAVWSFSRSGSDEDAPVQVPVAVDHGAAGRPSEEGVVDAAAAMQAAALGAAGAPTAQEAAPPSVVKMNTEDAMDGRVDSPGPARARQQGPRAVEDLLLKANGLRSEGRWKEAEALYLRVIRAQPSSLAAYVARVASGSLRLEHLRDARGALHQFQAALRLQPRGVLDQEAQHGIAEAHRVLGNRDAERSALEELLANHPDSPLGPSARARVRELSAP